MLRYNQLQIFGQPKPKPLSDIYINVNVLENLTSHQPLSAKELNRTIDLGSKTLGRVRETSLAIDAVNQYPKLIVLGKPGAGKTTMLKLITLYAIADQLNAQVLPIFVALKRWADSGLSLMAFIMHEFDICNFPDADGFVTRMLKQGKCLLLFDGYDEIPNPETKGVQEVQDFIIKYDKNRYILSCRIAAYYHTFEGFTLVEIADFVDKQKKIFVEKWFSETPQKGKQCWSKLSTNNSIKELAGTPLLLAMLCVQYDEAMGFPDNRAELYQEATQTLLRRWDASKNIERRPVYKDMSIVGKESLLSHLAYSSFVDGEYFIPQRVIEARIKEYIENIPNAENHNLGVDSNRVLRAIETNHGLLVERASRVYSFSHLTFQEYYTAKYFVEDQTRLQSMVEHQFDPKWKEVILLTSGLIPSRSVSDRFMRSIRESINTFAEKKKLLPSLNLGYATIKKNSPYSNLVSRVLVIIDFIGQNLGSNFGRDPGVTQQRIHVLTQAQDLARSMALELDFGGVLTDSLESDLIETLEQSQEVTGEREMTQPLGQVWGLEQDLDLDLHLAWTKVLDRALIRDRNPEQRLNQEQALKFIRALEQGPDKAIDRLIEGRSLKKDKQTPGELKPRQIT